MSIGPYSCPGCLCLRHQQSHAETLHRRINGGGFLMMFHFLIRTLTTSFCAGISRAWHDKVAAMFRSRMTQILFRGSAPATAPKPSLGAQRIPSAASPQITTRSARFSNSSRSWTTQSRSPFRTFRSQPFSTFGRRSFNNGGQNYKRFNNAPPLIQLLSRLQPHHYMMIGLGGGLFYVYNIETVEVCRHTCPVAVAMMQSVTAY